MGSKRGTLSILLLLACCFCKGSNTNSRRCHSDSSSSDQCPNPTTSPTPTAPDYLIVGAGGSGIQTALFLKNYGYSYTILEKAETAASFWNKFPVFDELISVNKKVQNETQRFRYDWHSFLGTGIRMLDVSQDYFPTGKQWHEYMNMVVEEEGLNVEYGVEVANIESIDDGDDTRGACVRLIDNTLRCANKRVFIGTGLKEKHEPYLRAIGGMPYSKMKKELAVGKKVCIVGNGNAGFEVAANTFPVADRVILYGKHPARLSSVTKYTGDVRVKFLTVLENFHGKLLDTVLNLENPLQLEETTGYLNRSQTQQLHDILNAAIYVNIHKCEVLVLATGFRSHVPGMKLRHRFPLTEDWYESRTNPNVHYVGWLMHQRDFRRGAGGFLSGFRYLIRNLIHHVREEDDGIAYPYKVMSGKEVLEHAVNRFQISDDLIILQDGVVLRDAILSVKTKDNAPPMNNSIPNQKKKGNTYHYYEGVNYNFHKEFENREDTIYLYFAWGDGRSAASVFDNVWRYNDTMALRNIYLHPVVEVNGLVREAEEDLDMIWNTDQFILPIKRILRDAMRKNYEKFYPKPDYSYKPWEISQPTEKNPHEQGKHEGVTFIDGFIDTAGHAVLQDGSRSALRELRHAAMKTMETLEFPNAKKRIN